MLETRRGSTQEGRYPGLDQPWSRGLTFPDYQCLPTWRDMPNQEFRLRILRTEGRPNSTGCPRFRGKSTEVTVGDRAHGQAPRQLLVCEQ